MAKKKKKKGGYRYDSSALDAKPIKTIGNPDIATDAELLVGDDGELKIVYYGDRRRSGRY